MQGVIITEVWTDSLGTFQARCRECNWRGPWHRSEDLAAQDAKDHGSQEAERDRAEEAAYEAHREEEGTLEEIEEHERELAAERLADRSE